jgi:ATP-dependent DNA helicase RecG
MQLTLQTPIEFLQGINPTKAALLQRELQIYTLADLASYYPFRYEDPGQLSSIQSIHKDTSFVQLQGTIQATKVIDAARKRLVAILKDPTGTITLVWFQKINVIAKQLRLGGTYQVFGRVTYHQGMPVLIHPELNPCSPADEKIATLMPVYHTTAKLKRGFIGSKYIRLLQRSWLQQLPILSLSETIPPYIREQYQLIDRRTAIRQVHFPGNMQKLKEAQTYLKFEELFYIQLRLLQLREIRLEKNAATPYNHTGLLTVFYRHHLPFSLTDAQKRVVKEIYADLRSGKQMNRLLQGDVGSGKTMVAFLAALLVVDGGGQVAFMAPTEILAQQHYKKWKELGQPLSLRVGILTGSTRPAQRALLLAALAQGMLSVLVGTHSLINEAVLFKNLGLAIIDEQQRFGVIQRAQLWQKPLEKLPHILFMSATPIPRTLAMTLYGDLDISMLDELPVGRKPIKTFHYYDSHRLKVFHLMRQQLDQGRQIYVVYPLIEESETRDYKNLLDGYDSLRRAFPGVPLSIVHGKMKPANKTYEMERFAKGETKIMVATTVIEVGVNVPNATMMVIENADRFALAQLHQLRGRVGRADLPSYCILLTGYKLSSKSKERIHCLVKSYNGFEIADMDLRLRGPGDLMGVQQSGGLALKIANLATDGMLLQLARQAAKEVMRVDPLLAQPQHHMIKMQLDHANLVSWAHIG